MRQSLRTGVGLAAGAVVLGAYLAIVGTGTVFDRMAAVAPIAVALVVVLEGLADSLGVWASVAPLNEGLSGRQSVQFALAGDFFDILSPAGPVSSEPIMARFISVETETGYSDALGVRSLAKYVKSGSQVCFSALVGGLTVLRSPEIDAVLSMLGVAAAGIVVLGSVVVAGRSYISTAAVTVITPVASRLIHRVSGSRDARSAVRSAVDRYWERILEFRETPALLVLIVLGGLLEQCLTAAALYVGLAGAGATVDFLPLLVVVPLPQIASVAPIPGSLGAYDSLLSGALVLVTGATASVALAAVLVVRTVSLPFGALTGGFCVAYLRGWRLSAGG